LSVWESLRLQREVVERYNQEKDFFGPPLYGEFVHFLPYYTLPYGWFQSHTVIVYGIDEDNDKVYLSDWSKQPLTITLKELAESRGVVRRIKNTTTIIEPPTETINLAKAIHEGIHDCHQGLLYGYTGMIRVDAWEMMAKRIANKKDKQGWSQLFNEPELLFDALTRLHAQISFFNSSGGALRSAYADFLDEASEVIGKAKLKEVSTLFRDVASKWDNLANAVLPNSISLFKAARIEALKWNDLFITKGQSAQRQLEITAEKIKSIRQQAIESFPLNEKEVLEFLTSLSQPLLSIHKCEREALEALKSIVP